MGSRLLVRRERAFTSFMPANARPAVGSWNAPIDWGAPKSSSDRKLGMTLAQVARFWMRMPLALARDLWRLITAQPPRRRDQRPLRPLPRLRPLGDNAGASQARGIWRRSDVIDGSTRQKLIAGEAGKLSAPASWLQRGLSQLGLWRSADGGDALAARRATIMKWIELVLSLGLMAVLQLASFVLLARAIGPADYGCRRRRRLRGADRRRICRLWAQGRRSCGRSRATRRPSRSRSDKRCSFRRDASADRVFSVILVRFIYPLDTPLAVVVALTASDLTSVRMLALSEQVALAGRNIRVANAYRVAPIALRLAVVVVACYAFRRSKH